jgi:hypothetical protein
MEPGGSPKQSETPKTPPKFNIATKNTKPILNIVKNYSKSPKFASLNTKQISWMI